MPTVWCSAIVVLSIVAMPSICRPIAASLMMGAETTDAIAAPMNASLRDAVSARPCTVAEVVRASVPLATTWFRLRPTDPAAGADQAQWPCGQKCWFMRTAKRNKQKFEGPQNIQELSFCALAEAPRGTSISIVVEAWSDRNDLPDKLGELLAVSGAMTFVFDDHGFSEQANFINFTAVQNSIGSITITAQPADLSWYSMARLISWSGYVPAVCSGAARCSSSLPSFSPNSFSEAYSTDEFSPPSINVSYSRP